MKVKETLKGLKGRSLMAPFDYCLNSGISRESAVYRKNGTGNESGCLFAKKEKKSK